MVDKILVGFSIGELRGELAMLESRTLNSVISLDLRGEEEKEVEV